MKNIVMMNLKSVLVLCLVLLMTSYSYAQEKKIEGTVIGEEGEPLIGATIMLKGKAIGTVADDYGNFKLSIPQDIDSICISFIGYTSICVAVKDIPSPYTFKLKEADSLIFGGVTIVDNRIIENFSATQVTTIRPSLIRSANTSTSADLLEHTGQVYVQRSQQGGGSPVLRGLEANRILLMVDGMRINNAIFRGGHLQNVLTVDQNLLEGADVYFGPNSLTYGSDALGGVVNFKTFQPMVGMPFKANFVNRFSSANTERMLHGDVSYSKGKWAGLSSITFSKFGDMISGKSENPFNSFQWRRDSLVITQGTEDLIIANDDPYKQTPNGYHQWNLNQKVRYEPNDNTVHTLSMSYTTTSDFARYDQLVKNSAKELDNTDFRFAEWYYGPQERFSTSYSLYKENPHNDEHAIWDILQLIVFYQSMEESRISRRFGNLSQNNQIERVNSLGSKLDMQLQPDWGRVQVGVEAYYDRVSSEAFDRNISNNAISSAQTRYPDGGSNMMNYGLYASLIRDFTTWQVSTGLRYSYSSLHAEVNDKTFFDFPFSEIDQRNTAVTGSVNFTKKWKHFKLNGLISSAFRSPNVDDVSKVFESQAGGDYIIPNEELEPENAYNAEIAGIWKSERLRWQLSFYHNWLRNMIQRGDAIFNGQDSIVVDGELTNVVSNQNIGKARIYGFYASLNYQPIKQLALEGTVSYTKGIDISSDEEVPLAHIPPVYGKFSVNYKIMKWKVQNMFYVQFNSWKRLEDFGPEGTPDRHFLARETDGFPAWYTINYRATWQTTDKIQLQVGVDNILDIHYRPFNAGLSAPGRNFIIALRGKL